MLIDLHTHTTCSDGLLSVNDLVKLAIKKKIKLLALTDHDTIAGIPLFLKLCRVAGIAAVPGIELSTDINGMELHLVGYIKNINYPPLLKNLKDQQKKRCERAKKVIKIFKKLKFIFDRKSIKTLLKQPNVGKPQIGRAILKHKTNRQLLKKKYGFKGGLSKFINNFLDKPGQIGYIYKKRINSLKAIDLIKKSNGLIALAHPDIELTNHNLAKKIIPQLARAGLWGMEMPHNFIENKKYLMPLARQYGLTVTYGSDTHDKKRLGIKIKNKEAIELIKKIKRI